MNQENEKPQIPNTISVTIKPLIGAMVMGYNELFSRSIKNVQTIVQLTELMIVNL